MRAKVESKKRVGFRIIDSGFDPDNIYKYEADDTISLGPVMVATIAAKSIPWLDVDVISENNYRRCYKGPRTKDGLPDHLALQRQKPAQIVGISASITNAVPRALELIRLYRDMPEDIRPKAIIVGGWHAGDLPEEFLKAGADVVVHGEAEPIIAPLIETLLDSKSLEKISGISYWSNNQIKRNPVFESCYEGEPGRLIVPQEEMDLLPHPDFGLVRFAKIKWLPTYRVRGCSGRCRFCRVKSKPRWLSAERFVDQIQVNYSKGYRCFFNVDDRSEENWEDFLKALQLLVEWRKLYRIRRIHIMTQDRLSLGEHPEILRLMRQAGIGTVAIGFESPIPEELWAMKKPIKPEKMVEWARAYRRAGILVHGMLIWLYPIAQGKPQPLNKKGEVMSVKERAAVFWKAMRAWGADTYQILFFTPIPGTEDWDDLEKEGRILHELGWKYWTGLHLVFRPDDGLDPIEALYYHKVLHFKFYAFRWLWPLSWLTIGLHWIRIIVYTPLMPFLWVGLLPFKKRLPGGSAWYPLQRIFRNNWRHFEANLITLFVSLKLKSFREKLETVLGHKNTV